MTDIPPAELYRHRTSAEAADFLQVSLQTLERYRRMGTGPRYIRVNPTHIAYRLVDLITFQQAHLAGKEVAHG